MIDQRLLNLAVAPNGGIRRSLEIVQQSIQMIRAQREIPYDELYNLTKSGMHNSELLARFLSLRLVAEEHLEWPDLVLMVFQRSDA